MGLTSAEGQELGYFKGGGNTIFCGVNLGSTFCGKVMPVFYLIHTLSMCIHDIYGSLL